MELSNGEQNTHTHIFFFKPFIFFHHLKKKFPLLPLEVAHVAHVVHVPYFENTMFLE